MKYDFYILDVFSSEQFGGNQLGVLPNATGLTTEGMQKIAREFNFAESTFVLPPEAESATAKVRIFTPNNEVDFAGHPTVGTACALIYGNHVDTYEIVLEENVGLVSVAVEDDGGVLNGTLTNTTPLEQPNERPAKKDLAEVLGIQNEEIIEGFFAGVGLEFCFARLVSSAVIDKANIDKTKLSERFGEAWSSNMFFFAGELDDGNELYARMSAPFMGIEEDPATGSAVAALVGVAANRAISDGVLGLSVVQGVKMGRESYMKANAVVRGGHLVSVGVGGASVLTANGQIEVADKWCN